MTTFQDVSSKSLADGKMATTTVALTTDEVTTPTDKKAMRKRVRHFLKKHKSVSGAPMKPESKLSKIQKSMMSKQHQQYQPIPLIEVVRSFVYSFVFSMFSRSCSPK